MLSSPLSLGLCAMSLLVRWADASAQPGAIVVRARAAAATTTPTSPTATTITTSTIAPSTTCGPGSTLTSTPDCTYPSITHTYCYSPPPPLTCPPSSYPGVYNPGHCITASTCFPVSADYLTQSCPPGHGLTTYSVSTVYSGTLAGESTATIITYVQCYCPSTNYYSYHSYTTSGSTVYDSFCLPHTGCAPGMTTSTSTNEYCKTAPPASCSGFPTTIEFCACGASSTPVYSCGTDSSIASGCRRVGGLHPKSCRN